MPDYHIAQINIARMLAPIDNPIMAEFVEKLAPVNALADESSGFVWRLQSESGDATSIQIYDDHLIIINLTVWESVDALREFVYEALITEFCETANAGSRNSMVHITLYGGFLMDICPARKKVRKGWIIYGNMEIQLMPFHFAMSSHNLRKKKSTVENYQ